LSSFFGKELILGSFLSRFLPLVTALYILYYKKNNLPLFLVFFIIITSLIIFLSGERISFFFACLFLLIFFISIDLTKVVKFFSIFFIITSVLTTSYFYKTSSSRMYVQTFNQIFNPNGGIEFFSEDHKAHAKTAYNIFKSNIFIGAGPKSFRKICHKPEYNYNEKSCTTHPHNTFLQLLAEVGLIGTLIPIFFLFLVIKKLFMNFCGIIKIKKYEIYFLSSFLISLFPFIPSGNFFNGWLNIVFYLPLGFYLNYKKRANT
jgi:oligosaccharide repeat unit polymerase